MRGLHAHTHMHMHEGVFCNPNVAPAPDISHFLPCLQMLGFPGKRASALKRTCPRVFGTTSARVRCADAQFHCLCWTLKADETHNDTPAAPHLALSRRYRACAPCEAESKSVTAFWTATFRNTGHTCIQHTNNRATPFSTSAHHGLDTHANRLPHRQFPASWVWKLIPAQS